MSTISNRHSVISYTGKEKAFENNRLVKCTWKETKNNKNPISPKCVSVSLLKLNDGVLGSKELKEIVIGYLESVQDKMIKEIIQENRNMTEIDGDKIGLEGIVGYLNREKIDGRIGNEKIIKWFDECIQDGLRVLILVKGMKVKEEEVLEGMISEEQNKIVEEQIGHYRKVFIGLVQNDVFLEKKEIDRYIGILENCDMEQSVLGTWLIEKVRNSRKPELDELEL